MDAEPNLDLARGLPHISGTMNEPVRARHTRPTFAALAFVALVTGCPTPEPPVDPIFPENYASEWTMVRDCRRSIEHDLSFVQVWADPVAAAAYTSREGTFPNGSLIVKEEFDDPGCTDLSGWTVMRREADFAPAAGDWRWQEVAADRTVVDDGSIFRCFSCHEDCGEPPDGFDWTCAVP